MNFDFPLKELPVVMRGPRVERRRVMLGGTPVWGTIVEEGPAKGQLRLDDGRVVDPAGLTHLPPVAPSKIIGGTAPIISDAFSAYSNPLPHVLILTAIVVGVATLALGLALVVRIREAYDSIEEDEIVALDIAAGAAPPAR